MKMKKIAAAMFATVMALSLTACGAPTVENTGANSEDTSDVQITTECIDTDTEQSKPAENATTSAVTEATEQTTTPTTAPAEPEIPEVLPVLNVEPVRVMNGSMAFKCDGKNYVYNITDNELYETEYDVNDITVLKGCVAVFGHVAQNFDHDYYGDEPYVVNLKTGEQYADVRPFYNDNWNDNSYLVVGMLEESFSGIAVSIGMLNDKGEWILPLSANHAICDVENIDKTDIVYQNGKTIGFHINGHRLYDVTNDKIIALKNLDNTPYIIDITDEAVILGEGSGLMNAYVTLYRYDISTGEKTYIAESHGLETEIPTCITSQKNADGIYEIYDKNYNLLDYDLSEYDFTIRTHEIKGATEDAVVFHATGADGNIYTVIQNKNGDFICEPFIYNKSEAANYDAHFSENKIVIKYNKANDCIIDINTGEITNLDNNFKIIWYDDINDLMLVNTNGAYYLVDPEAPDVLINPFERAYN